MVNGSVKEFLLTHPNFERVNLVCDLVSRDKLLIHTSPYKLQNIVDGLKYLHSLHVVHGDLKSVGTTNKFNYEVTTHSTLTGEHPHQFQASGLSYRFRAI